MNERRGYTDEERYIIAVLRRRNNISDTVPDEEVLPPLDEHIEYKMEEFRFGFSFPWRYIGSVLQEKIIDYERQLAGDEILNEMPDVCYTELFDEFKGDLCILDWTIAREIADRYGLWGAYPQVKDQKVGKEGKILKIYDFDKFNLEQKKYGGSDKKYSIKVDNTYVMVKEPVETQKQNGLKSDYSNTCLSEYLGSHIYQTLGFNAQNTFLGMFTCSDGKKKLCVACEDFTDNKNMGTEGLFLQEFYSYIKDWNRVCKDYGFKEKHKTEKQEDHGFLDEIEEILNNDLYLGKQPEMKEMFYNMFVVDAFIANRDRHNHNWGFMVSIHPYGDTARKVKYSPIYDNGGTLYPNASDSFLAIKADNLEDEIKGKDFPNSNICEYYAPAKDWADQKSWMNRISYYKYIYSFKNKELNKAILRMSPIIEDALPEINNIIDDMKECGAITDIRAEAYKKILEKRFNILIKEPYLALKKVRDGNGGSGLDGIYEVELDDEMEQKITKKDKEDCME